MHFLVDSYIEALPVEQQKICAHIRTLLWQRLPEIEEKFSFKIPFYHLHGSMFCYMNKVGNYIECCFCRGTALQLTFPQIIVGERKLIGGILLSNVKDIYAVELPAIIDAAAILQYDYFIEKNESKRKNNRK